MKRREFLQAGAATVAVGLASEASASEVMAWPLDPPELDRERLVVGWLGLPRAGGQEQHDDQEEEAQLVANPEGFDFVSNWLRVHCYFPFVFQMMMINPRITLTAASKAGRRRSFQVNATVSVRSQAGSRG